MGSNSHNNRFPLPENWSVEDFICMVVPVPNDPEYTAIIMGLIETLTWSRSFHHHPTENAARQVADTWSAAFASREITFISCEEIDMSLLLRVKPGYPNISQSSSDGGITWVDFLIQPTWIGATGASAVWPVPMNLGERNELAGGIVSGTLKYLASRIIAMDGDSLSRDEIQNNLEDEFRRFRALPEAINLIRPAIDAILDSPTPTVYEDDCTYLDFFSELRDWIQGHPNNFNEGLSNLFVNYANEVGDSAVELMATIYYAFGGADNLYNLLADHESIREPSFGDTCDFEHTFDFATGTHGWVPSLSGEATVQAHYVAGVGWGNNPAFHTDRAIIELAISPSVTLTGGTLTLDTGMTGDNRYGWWQEDGYAGIVAYYMAGATEHTETWSPIDCGLIVAAVDDQSGHDGTTLPSKIASITLRGPGLDPFEGL